LGRVSFGSIAERFVGICTDAKVTRCDEPCAEHSQTDSSEEDEGIVLHGHSILADIWRGMRLDRMLQVH